MASPAANGASNEANGSVSRSSTAGHQQGKSSFASKMSENSRKADEETSQRRTPQSHKAWTSGVNPITQRSNTPSQTNGATVRPANGVEKVADRQTWIFNNAVGLQCTITLKSGEKFLGIFAGAQKPSESQKVLFKMIKDITRDASNNAFCGLGPEHIMAFPVNSLETFEVPEAPPVARVAANGNSASFRTDTDISGHAAGREKERPLQRWEAPSGKGIDMSLESSTGEWDQFKANEERFGLKSDYNENIYTTTIDYKDPLYAQRAREAERIAREIEGSAATNAHVREERGLDDGAGDEEEKYSGVRRDYQPLQSTQPDRYIPPSKRTQLVGATPASTTKPPAENAIDPAIISSQMTVPKPPAESQKKTAHAPVATPTTATATTAAPKPTSTAAPAPPPAPGLSISTAASSKENKPIKTPGRVENAVLDSFRQFAANEKLKVQDQKRTKAFQDKAVKLNDLMKFSKNFKLLTPVPKDLVPILAKDETKQKEIIEKAQLNAQSSATKSPGALADSKSSWPLAPARWENESGDPTTGAPAKDSSRQGSIAQTSTKERSSVSGQGGVTPSSQTSLSTRLNNNHQAHTARMAPNNLTMQENRGKGSRANYTNLPSPQKSMGSRGPPSATSLKFNARAMEFNPNASAFKPTAGSISGTTAVTAASSPRSGTITRTLSPAGPPPSILGDRKDFTVAEGKNPRTETVQPPVDPDADGKGDPTAKALSKAMAGNGGFAPAYHTAPTWPGVDPDDGPDYKAVFEERRPKRQPNPSPSSGLAHQYQLPPHLQQNIHGSSHAQQHHHGHQHHPQPQHFNHGQHFEDNHMRPSHSQSSFAPSPRMGTQSVGYASPMPQPAHIAYPPNMQYPPQGHPMSQRQFSNPPTMIPVQGTTHLTPMMVPHGQPTFIPQVGVPFNPQQMHVYANPGGQPMYVSPSQPPNGYPSPGRGAPMMMHQGSQQGQQPVYMSQHNQYGQPVYAQGPPQMPGMRANFGSPQPPFAQNAGYPQPQQQQQPHYPLQPHRTPSSGYAQPQQQQHIPTQPAGTTEMAEDAK